MMDIEELKKIDSERADRLKFAVDSAILKIMNVSMSHEEALNIVLKVRGLAIELFPDKIELFDMIYGSRFKRTIEEFVNKK